jgi:UDP-N-acetylglucosamine 2-epimerase (non-hydrolysing)
VRCASSSWGDGVSPNIHATACSTRSASSPSEGTVSCPGGAASTVLVSDDPELVADAPGLGTPAVLVDGPHVPEPGDSIRSILSPAVMDTVRQVLGAPPGQDALPSDGLEALRVEQAVAWMFGLTPSPQLDEAHRTST